MTVNYLPLTEAYLKLDALLHRFNMAEREGTILECAGLLADMKQVLWEAETFCNDEIFRGSKARA